MDFESMWYIYLHLPSKVVTYANQTCRVQEKNTTNGMEKGDHYSKHRVFRNIQQDYGCCTRKSASTA